MGSKKSSMNYGADDAAGPPDTVRTKVLSNSRDEGDSDACCIVEKPKAWAHHEAPRGNCARADSSSAAIGYHVYQQEDSNDPSEISMSSDLLRGSQACSHVDLTLEDSDDDEAEYVGTTAAAKPPSTHAVKDEDNDDDDDDGEVVVVVVHGPPALIKAKTDAGKAQIAPTRNIESLTADAATPHVLSCAAPTAKRAPTFTAGEHRKITIANPVTANPTIHAGKDSSNNNNDPKLRPTPQTTKVHVPCREKKPAAKPSNTAVTEEFSDKMDFNEVDALVREWRALRTGLMIRYSGDEERLMNRIIRCIREVDEERLLDRTSNKAQPEKSSRGTDVGSNEQELVVNPVARTLDDEEWACSRCALLNQPRALVCRTCDTEVNPVDSSMKVLAEKRRKGNKFGFPQKTTKGASDHAGREVRTESDSSVEEFLSARNDDAEGAVTSPRSVAPEKDDESIPWGERKLAAKPVKGPCSASMRLQALTKPSFARAGAKSTKPPRGVKVSNERPPGPPCFSLTGAKDTPDAIASVPSGSAATVAAKRSLEEVDELLRKCRNPTTTAFVHPALSVSRNWSRDDNVAIRHEHDVSTDCVIASALREFERRVKKLGPYVFEEFCRMWESAERNLGVKTEQIEKSPWITQANRTMQRSDTTSQYNAQYGRMLPRLAKWLIQTTGLSREKTFLDIGSGIGNTCLQYAFTVGCNTRGIEVVESRYMIGNLFCEDLMKQHEKDRTLEEKDHGIGQVDLRHGRLEDPRNRAFLTEEVDVALCNNYNGVFKRCAKVRNKYNLDDFVAGLFCKMKPGAVLITLDRLDIGPACRTRANKYRSACGLDESDDVSFYEMEELICVGKDNDLFSWQGGGEKQYTVFKYTRVTGATFMCCNPHCEQAQCNAKIQAWEEVMISSPDQPDEPRVVVNTCHCKVDVGSKTSRKRRAPDCIVLDPSKKSYEHTAERIVDNMSHSKVDAESKSSRGRKATEFIVGSPPKSS